MVGAVTQRIPLFSNLYDSEEFKRQGVDLVASIESTEVLGVRHLVDELLPLEKVRVRACVRAFVCVRVRR